jgi:Protein of unknown function (DUF3563)
MSKIHALLMSFMPQIRSQQRLDEEYLAESVDLYDLERRMREIDGRAARQSFDLAAGLYTR